METLSVAEHIAAGIPSPPRRATPPREVTLVPPRRRPFHVRGIIDERDFFARTRTIRDNQLHMR